MKPSTKRSLAAAVSTSAIFLVAAPSALGLSTVKVDGHPVVGGEAIAGVAKCKPGQRVISGGFVAPNTGAAVAVNRAKGKRGWKVLAFNIDSLSVRAHCSKTLKPLTKKKQISFEGHDQRGSKAKCPGSTSVASGGWQYAEHTDNSPVYTSKPLRGSAWKVYAASDAASTDAITAYAYCLKHVKLKVRSASRSIGTDSVGRAAGPGDRTARTSCKHGETRYGGGFATSPKPDFSNTSGPDTFFNVAAGSGARGWKVSAHNYSQVAGKLTAIAICH